MTIYRIDIQSIGRSTRRSATDVAAYRAGESLVDERTGRVDDYSARRDVLHRELVLPERFAADEVPWARSRQSLWNAAEAAEGRRNSRFAREFVVSLPHELDPARRQALTLGFSRAIAERYGVAVDVAVHAPGPTSDPRHFHAHLLATTREITHEGLGSKANLELSESVRLARGLLGIREEFKAIRAHWAELNNEAFREAGLDLRVDHRTLAEQGIDRPPQHLPWHVYKAERQALREAVLERTREAHRERALEAADLADRRDPEEVRRAARAAWLAYRESGPALQPETQATNTKEPSRARDTDLAL